MRNEKWQTVSFFHFLKNSTNPPLSDQKLAFLRGFRNSTGKGYLRSTEGNSIENLENTRGQRFTAIEIW